MLAVASAVALACWKLQTTRGMARAWTFSAGDNPVQLEDSVYLASNEGLRRTVQMVIHGHARAMPRVVWSFQQASAAALATAGTGRRVRVEEPRLPL